MSVEKIHSYSQLLATVFIGNTGKQQVWLCLEETTTTTIHLLHTTRVVCLVQRRGDQCWTCRLCVDWVEPFWKITVPGQKNGSARCLSSRTHDSGRTLLLQLHARKRMCASAKISKHAFKTYLKLHCREKAAGRVDVYVGRFCPKRVGFHKESGQIRPLSPRYVFGNCGACGAA